MTLPVTKHHPSTDREVAIAAARAGADVILRHFGSIVIPEMKGSVNPVTEVDRAAEEAVLDVIESARPADAILSEERGGRTDPVGRRWIVDPLDGTVNFIHGVPQVSVSVGLWDGAAPLAGAVIDVTRGEEFSAARGEGASLGDTPIRVSPKKELAECLIATGFPYDRDMYAPAYTKVMGQVMARARDVRRFGSAALDFAWVACGRVDGFWEYGLHPWDVAAGLLLVAEAGGESADLVSAPATVCSTDFIIAAPGIAEQLIELIRSAAPPHVRAAG